LSPGEIALFRLRAENIALKRENEELRKIVREEHGIDPLTGVASKLLVTDEIRRYFARWKRAQNMVPSPGLDFSVLFLDINNFKPVNDTYGHLVGDLLLRKFADHLRAMVRKSDVVGRFGGDEFVIIADDTDSAHSVQLVGKIKDGLSALRFERSNKTPITIQVSIGFASSSENFASPEALIQAADMRMLCEKKARRA
jgi:diguanylate cyclase (GGDEF)-like protein